MALHLLLVVAIGLLWLGSVGVYLSLLYAYGTRQQASKLPERC